MEVDPTVSAKIQQNPIETLELDSMAKDFIARGEELQKTAEKAEAPTKLKVSPKQRYKKRSTIGRGGMGQVLEVFDRDLNRTVAMKTLLQKALTQKEVELFIAEAQVNSQLDHPNMVPVHDIGLGGDGRVYFTMRMVRNQQSLTQIIDKLREGDPEAHQVYTFERRVQLIQQVCNALEYAHQRGVVHCDIKPDNILVGDCGQLFVVDWGIATLADKSEEAHPHGTIETTVNHVQEEGKVYGTLRYMAPERITSSKKTTLHADVFSVCAVLYELLSLHHYLGALPETTMMELIAKIQTAPRVLAITHFDPLNGRVPLVLARICNRGLAVDPSERLASISTLNRELQHWLEKRSPMVCPSTSLQRILAGYIRKIDRHPYAMMLGTLAGLGAFITLFALASWQLISGS